MVIVLQLKPKTAQQPLQKTHKKMQPKIRLFTSFYFEKNIDRRRELLQCLADNALNSYIDGIYVLLEGNVDYPVEHKKIRYYRFDKRPTFLDYFSVMNSVDVFLEDCDISIIANSDITFDETILLALEMDKNDCYTLSRWEINEDGSEGGLVQSRGDSSDSVVVKGKIKKLAYCDFPMGFMGADNRIAHELKMAGYRVINPCLSVQSWHLHNTNIRNYNEADRNEQNVIKPPYLIVRPTELTKRLSDTKLLHIGLSANSTPKNGLTEAFEKYFDYREINCGIQNLDGLVIHVAGQFRPDIVFIQIQTAGVLSIATVAELKRLGAFVINYTGDVRSPLPQFYYDMANVCDLTLFTNYNDIRELQLYDYAADFQELGIDAKIFTPIGEQRTAKPVLMLANNYGHNHFPLSLFRIQAVNYLKKVMPDKFSVYGFGWGEIADGNLNISQHVEAAYYRGTKIAINISHFDYDRYSSDRLTRILGCGVMCLSKRIINGEERFKDGIHLRYWDTFEELEELINYYLEHDDEREAIAKAGCELVHAEYTFDNLASNISNLYKNSKN